NITCYECNEKGHISTHCPKRKKGGGGGGKSGGGGNSGGGKKRGFRGGKKKKEEGDSPKSDQAHQASDDYAFTSFDTPDIALPALTSSSILADCAATSHIFRDRAQFSSYVDTPGHQIKGFGSTAGMGRGTVKLTSKVGGKDMTITLRNVVHAPDAPYNLVSVSRMTDARFSLKFEGESLRIFAPDGSTDVLRGRKIG
ncbi:hypothetical protein FPV67DRAFT_1394325, partial [Lyophyllum atratum]